MNERNARLARGSLVVKLVQAGWRPPPLTDTQAERLLDDIEESRGTLELTGREIESLTCVADGLTIHQAADRMCVSFEGARDRLDRARVRLGAKNVTHAVALALRRGLIE